MSIPIDQTELRDVIREKYSSCRDRGYQREQFIASSC